MKTKRMMWSENGKQWRWESWNGKVLSLIENWKNFLLQIRDDESEWVSERRKFHVYLISFFFFLPPSSSASSLLIHPLFCWLLFCSFLTSHRLIINSLNVYIMRFLFLSFLFLILCCIAIFSVNERLRRAHIISVDFSVIYSRLFSLSLSLSRAFLW